MKREHRLYPMGGRLRDFTITFDPNVSTAPSERIDWFDVLRNACALAYVLVIVGVVLWWLS